MSAHDQQKQELLRRAEELQAKRLKYQHEVEKFRNELTAARPKTRQARSVPQASQENLDEDREISPSQESRESSSDSDQDSCCTAVPCIPEDPGSAPAAPSEETLTRYATTVAYSSYSKLCGTSDRSLIYHLFENDLQKEPSGILGPKKMIDIPQDKHNITYLKKQIAEGASLFATRMIEARRRVDPEVTTDDQVRRLGPANVPGDNLPIYWIVTFSQQGVVDWEGGCSLARAYRRVFEDFGAEDVHCLIFECETGLSSGDAQKAYAIE